MQVPCTNDASDWGVKIDKDGTDTYGLLVYADGTMPLWFAVLLAFRKY